MTDIKDIWHEIGTLQKKVFGFILEKKADTFGRDLAWYDLHKEFALTISQITKAWAKHCPKGVDQLVIKSFKRKYLDELKVKLKSRSSALKDHPLLLKMILGSELGDDLRTSFHEQKRIYSTGEFEPGKRFAPRLSDAIKQGIKRIEKYIELCVPKDPWEKLGAWSKETGIKYPRVIDVPWLRELAKIEADLKKNSKQG